MFTSSYELIIYYKDREFGGTSQMSACLAIDSSSVGGTLCPHLPRCVQRSLTTQHRDYSATSE